MNEIYNLIEQISLDAKQEAQIKALFKLGFINGMAFKQNIPDVDPKNNMNHFNNVYEMFLIASQDENVEFYNSEMKKYERGEKTELL